MDEPPSVTDEISPEAFARLPWFKRLGLRSQRRREDEWRTAQLPGGAIIARLRDRARTFETRALWVLSALIATVVAGLFFYIALPILQDNERSKIAFFKAELVAVRETRIPLIDKDAAQLGDRIAGRLRDFGELFVTELPPILRPSDVTPTSNRNLFGVAIGSDNRIIIAGAEGLIAERLPDGDFEPLGISDGDGRLWSVRHTLYSVAIGPSNRVIAVGEDGTVLTRGPTDTAFQHDPHPTRGEDPFIVVLPVEETLNDVAISGDDSVVIVGGSGTIITQASIGRPFVQAEPAAGTPNLRGVAFTSDSRAIAVGGGGTLLVRPPQTPTFLRRPLQGVDHDLWDVAVGTNDAWFVAGESGKFTELGPDGTPLRHAAIDGVLGPLRAVATGRDNTTFIVGWQGAVLRRAAGEQSFQRLTVPGVPTTLTDIAIGKDNKAVVVGLDGLVLLQQPEIASGLDAVESLDDLPDAIEAIPEHARVPEDFEQLAALHARMQRAEAAIREWEDRIAEAKDALTGLSEVAPAQVKGDWTNALLDRLPGVILLLFLLATFGTLYRYNLRMVGFYHARADAVQLAAEASVDRERVKALAEMLAADKVEFRDSKTPVDTVTDIAKEAMKKVK